MCNSVTPDALTDLGLEKSDHMNKFSSYWCPQCKRTLYIDECFQLFHTFKDFASEKVRLLHELKIAQTNNSQE